jgi:hypothetical protein
MPRPLRAELFDPNDVCIVHCVQRCVRRAFLGAQIRATHALDRMGGLGMI